MPRIMAITCALARRASMLLSHMSSGGSSGNVARIILHAGNMRMRGRRARRRIRGQLCVKINIKKYHVGRTRIKRAPDDGAS